MTDKELIDTVLNAVRDAKRDTAIEILNRVGEMYVSDYESNEVQIKDLAWFRATPHRI